MKLLPKEIQGRGEVSGLLFLQIKRDGDICLYERSDGFFEIITPFKQRARTAFFDGVKVEYEEKEIYPTGDSWSGSCVGSLELAEKIFKRKIRERDGGLNESNL